MARPWSESVEDRRWEWKGEWQETKQYRVAGGRGAEASIQFDGTGVILAGLYLPAGGKADVYLNGKLDRTVDVYPDEVNTKSNESVWHAFQLKPGAHHLRIAVRGESYPGSNGTEIGVTDLVVFR